MDNEELAVLRHDLSFIFIFLIERRVVAGRTSSSLALFLYFCKIPAIFLSSTSHKALDL